MLSKEEILDIHWHRAITISRGKNKRGKLHLTNHDNDNFIALCNRSVHVTPYRYPRSRMEQAYNEDRVCQHCLKLLEE